MTDERSRAVVDPKEAARGLHARLRHKPWHSTVGADGVGLAVHVHRMPTGEDRALIPSRHEGLPVSIRYGRNPPEEDR